MDSARRALAPLIICLVGQASSLSVQASSPSVQAPSPSVQASSLHPDTSAPTDPQNGVLHWGGDAEGGAPYVEADPANPAIVRGFEVEVAELLARGLGVRAQFVQVAFASIDASVSRGDCDIGMNGIEDTPRAARRWWCPVRTSSSARCSPSAAETPPGSGRSTTCAAAASAVSAVRSPTSG